MTTKGNDGPWVTILAGGIGSRFWPASTPERPKQLLPLATQNPLIVDTMQRARALTSLERVRVLAGGHLAAPFQAAMPELPESCYWIEPKARGTAPVLAWAAKRVMELDPDGVIVSLHADHLIEPLEGLAETVETAVEIARRDELLLSIGAVPDRIETGYGHIEPGDALPEAGAAKGFRVTAFHEKPDAETAARYVDAGYLWNTGIFVWKASVLLEEITRHAPELAACLPLLQEGDAAFFDAAPVSVIDRAVMERSERVGCVAARFEWDDVGSWEALARSGAADATGNVVVGDASVVDGSENVVYADDGSRVVLLGASNLVVVHSGRTTLVLPRSRAPEMKALMEQLPERDP